MNRFISFFQNIINSGLLPKKNALRNREIRLTNYVALIISCVVLLLFIIRRLRYGDVEGGITLVQTLLGVILFLTPILLNKLTYTNVSRMFLCYIPILFIWVINAFILKKNSSPELTSYDTMRIFFLGFSPLPFLLYNRKEYVWKIVATLPGLISIIFFEKILQLLHIDYLSKGIVSSDYPIMQVRTILSYAIISSICIVFRNIIHNSDRQKRRYLKKLKKHGDLIEKQNIVLIQNRKELALLNKNLEHLVEQKTIEVENRNRKILNFSHTNSHQIRASVARLLGLIQVSKIEKDLDFNWYIESLNNEVVELDAKVKKLTTELEALDKEGGGD